MNLLDMDGSFPRFLDRVADLLILNLLTVLLCVPVVTAGASWTAMHYVLLKMVRGEEGYVGKAFFHSFRQNFRQATLLWLLFLAAFFLMGGDLYVVTHTDKTVPYWLIASIAAVSFLLVMFMTFAFPLLARFTGTVLGTFRHAVALSFGKLPRAAAMAFLTLLPLGLAYHVRVLVPAVLLFGLSVPGYLCAKLYSPLFKRIEEKIRSAPG